MNSICRALSDSIKEGKWLSVTYNSNIEQRETSFWCAIKDIDPVSKTLFVDLFNDAKSFDPLLDRKIRFEKIKSAMVLDFSTYETPKGLIEKIEGNLDAFSWLHYENFNNDILMYMMECNKFDTDPHQKTFSMVAGIDLSVFAQNRKYPLSDQQIKDIVRVIYFNDLKRFDSSNNELALSDLSIDDGGKKYVVAYHTVCFNPSEKSLILVGGLHFNSTFMIDEIKHSLIRYIDIEPEEFMAGYLKDPRTYTDLLKENLHGSETIDTRPDLMILERKMPVNLANLYELIASKKDEGKLNVPLKAFFGDISRRNLGRKEPAIVLFDEKVNIDQMLVIYNAMKNPVTYVQGPPGTGKTQTLFNVIVSAYFNGKSTLVCSMNNKPVNGIVEKLVFAYHDKPVPFPYLRLGNQEEVAKATLKIRDNFDHPLSGKPDLEKIKDIKEQEAAKNANLIVLLQKYEAKRSLGDNIDCAKRLLSEVPNSKELEKEIRSLEEKYAQLPNVSNEEVIGLFSPASKNSRYLSYLYYSSIYHLNKLQLSDYIPLREIVSIEDPEERVSRFNAWTSSDENMKLLGEVYPLIFTTNISASRLGSGLFMFDLTIMDEAGQCDEAKSLIPIARGNSLLLVGDEDQLQPVIILDPAINEKLKEKYKISDNYDYETNSILCTMTTADNISKRVMLAYHYRCGRKIISFSDQYFYGKRLKLDFVPGEGEVTLAHVKNIHQAPFRNSALEEAQSIVDYVQKSHLKDASIITPFVNQQYLINTLLAKNGITDVKASTIHSVQGAEASTIILSPAVSYQTSPRSFEWLKEHREIANVAITRAEQKLIVFADDEAIEKLTGTGDNVWNELVKYAKSKGNILVVPPPSAVPDIGKSNGSVNETEFYKTMGQLCTVYKNYHIKRNVMVKDVFSTDPDLSHCGMEFDAVVYSNKSFFHPERPIVIFEINGGEHCSDPQRRHNDIRKTDLCHKKGIQLRIIDNRTVKDYECLIELIKKMNHEQYDQMLLDFEDGPEISKKEAKSL